MVQQKVLAFHLRRPRCCFTRFSGPATGLPSVRRHISPCQIQRHPVDNLRVQYSPGERTITIVSREVWLQGARDSVGGKRYQTSLASGRRDLAIDSSDRGLRLPSVASAPLPTYPRRWAEVPFQHEQT